MESMCTGILYGMKTYKMEFNLATLLIVGEFTESKISEL